MRTDPGYIRDIDSYQMHYLPTIIIIVSSIIIAKVVGHIYYTKQTRNVVCGAGSIR